MSKNTKTGIIGAVVLVVLIAVLLVVWKSTRKAPEAGEKTLSVSITHMDGTERKLTIKTDREYLLDAMLDEKLVSGYESEFGYTVDTVDGEFADADKGEWWVFTKSGEWVDTSINATVIVDGDSFEFAPYVS